MRVRRASIRHACTRRYSHQIGIFSDRFSAIAGLRHAKSTRRNGRRHSARRSPAGRRDRPAWTGRSRGPCRRNRSIQESCRGMPRCHSQIRPRRRSQKFLAWETNKAHPPCAHSAPFRCGNAAATKSTEVLKVSISAAHPPLGPRLTFKDQLTVWPRSLPTNTTRRRIRTRSFAGVPEPSPGAPKTFFRLTRRAGFAMSFSSRAARSVVLDVRARRTQIIERALGIGLRSSVSPVRLGP